MPTYQYACTACGKQLEVVQSFTDEPLTECPECAGRLRKVFSAVGVVFKGSGFYRTDSRKPAAAATDRSAGKEAARKEPAGTTPSPNGSKPAGGAAAASSTSSPSSAGTAA